MIAANIKYMGIKGFEKRVIGASKDFLSHCIKIKFSCCTHYFEEDVRILSNLFEQIKYHFEFSDEYMFFLNTTSLCRNYHFSIIIL